MKAVFIVEGTKDEDQIRNAFQGNDDVITLVTEGTKMNNKIKAKIEHYLNEGIGVYILSDPDIAGKHLAEMIQSWYPQVARIEVDDRQCAYFTGKKYKAGIEYASHRYLKKILSPYLGLEYVEKEYPICWD